MSVVGIKINNQGKIYYFNGNDLNLQENLNVIVETEKGLQYGQVVLVDNELENNNYNDVIRIATKKDYHQYQENLKKEKYAITKCNELIKQNKLKMKIINAQYSFDRTQITFKFIAEERVDFRQLARELGANFKARIELRQIGIRDKAKEVGGLGICGRKTCCSNFICDFDSVSINMAKNQSISLNPNKINGVCGRLLCCLKYENDNYCQAKKNGTCPMKKQEEKHGS